MSAVHISIIFPANVKVELPFVWYDMPFSGGAGVLPFDVAWLQVVKQTR